MLFPGSVCQAWALPRRSGICGERPGLPGAIGRHTGCAPRYFPKTRTVLNSETNLAPKSFGGGKKRSLYFSSQLSLPLRWPVFRCLAVGSGARERHWDTLTASAQQVATNRGFAPREDTDVYSFPPGKTLRFFLHFQPAWCLPTHS